MKYLPFAPMILAAFAPGGTAAEPPAWAEIRVVDSATGRGVPLVELETVHGLRFVTDNAGRVAFCEPGLMGREIFFTVRSHGHSVPKDGFGIAGARVTPNAGKPAEIRIARNIVAERLCRLTGEGLYRDSLLLGHKSPLAESAHPGKVAGQDSIQAAVYRGKVHYFWGDTLRMDYPLGLFRMAGATADVPDPKDPKSDPAAGIAYDYFTDAKTGFARALMPLPERPEGVIWISGVFVVPDAKGAGNLVGHYSRRTGWEKEYAQGLAVFDDAKGIFESAKTLPATEAWRKPNGHPIPFEEDGGRWLLFGSPNPNVRVPATLKDVLDPDKYEAYACEVDKIGTPTWSWQKARPPTDSKTERRWIAEKKLKPESARFCPADAANPAERVELHSGSVKWNGHRKRWIMLAGQIGGKASHLGEVWYAESKNPTGPFGKAVKVLTHDRQTFYNVCHHPFLDRDGGRTIHFEGTYTNDFSGNAEKTPRYNYNQVLYRLDLTAAGLENALVK